MTKNTTIPYEVKALSERERKVITSLKMVKRRREEGLFISEGIKTTELLLERFNLRWLVISKERLDLISRCQDHISTLRIAPIEVMKRLSQLESRQEIIAVFEYPSSDSKQITEVDGLSVALDEVQDPGNLGTIIRLCDWLGISSLICGKGCADPYSPKVIQASMGAIGNVDLLCDIDLPTFLPQHFDQIIATTMSGDDYRKVDRKQLLGAVLLFGNEGKGLSPNLLKLATKQIAIPRALTSISDSLNVSMSAAILLSSLIP